MRRPKTKVKGASRKSPSLAVIRVDSSRIRQECKADYERVLNDLKKARQQLDQFRNHDLPGFSRWVSRQFGPLLTEMRETTHKLQEQQQLLLQLQQEIFLAGVPPEEAYERVMRRRKHPKADEPAPEGSEEQEENDPWESESHRQARGRSGFHDPEDRFEQTKAPHLRGKGMARLKELYRALARRLHPDAQSEETAQKLEWWHQAQVAYQQGDAAQLEVILTLCEIEEQGTLEKTSVSVLQRITAEFRKTLRHLKVQLTQCRRDPAWNFSQRKDREELVRELRANLNHDMNMMKEELHMLELQMAAWAAHARTPRRGVYRRARSQDPWSFF